MSLDPQAQVTCKNCGNFFVGKYCNQCGEKVFEEHDRSFKHLFEEVFHFLTHFEGTFFNTLKVLPGKPGRISTDFTAGIRRKYFKPLSFFLMLVILYLMFPVYEGLNMRLQYHEMNVLYGKYATEKVEEVMDKKHYSKEELSEKFHVKGEKASKFLLFIIIPSMAVVSYMMGFRKRKYYYDHFIFSTEAVSFFILWGFLLLPLLSFLLHKVYPFEIGGGERFGVIVMFSGLAIYIAIASRRFFRFRVLYSIFFTFMFTVTLGVFVQLIYKAILFFVVIHLV
jgi:hypothetical protein